MSNDTQSDVREAFAELSKEPESASSAETSEPTGADSPAPVDDGSAIRGVDADADSSRSPDGGDAGSGGRARGPDGKFLPKPKTEAATKAPPVEAKSQTPAPVASPPALSQPPAPTTTTPTFKAPQSWKPEMREKFSTLPPELQAEISRAETEWQKFKGESGTARRVHQAIAPFEADFRAMGSDVAQALPGILSTVKALAKGDVQTKARILGQMVTAYLGKDEAGLKALAMAIDTPEQAAAVDPAAIEQRVLMQMQQQQENAAIQQALQEFGAEPREFLADVETVFSAIVQRRRASGEPPSAKMLQESYDQACWATPEVRAVLTQREAANKAKATQDAANKAKAASVSVRPSPVVAPPRDAATASTEDDVRAAFAELASRVR